MKLDKSVIRKIINEVILDTNYAEIKSMLEELDLVFKPNDLSQSILVEQKTFIDDEDVYKKPGWGED